ncbi:integrase core domain-containing protein [Kineococcus arenarius]|uniref:integrase core domain-containing protein n=1 Tax=Kineococcus sp. SYSU DK007 TaxID=3383128 RepID=UPI003D7EA7A6
MVASIVSPRPCVPQRLRLPAQRLLHAATDKSSFSSLFKAELIRNPNLPNHDGPWRGIDDVEIAVAEYIDWYNHRRLHGELGMIPPAEYEARFTTHPVPTAVLVAG